MQKLKVQLRNGFSDRNKIKLENVVMQLKDFDDRTRTAIINLNNIVIAFGKEKDVYEKKLQHMVKRIYSDLYCQEIKWDRNYDIDSAFEVMNKTIREDAYDDVLTVIEFFVNLYCQELNQDVYEFYNKVFEEEYVGYRFVDKQITTITDNVEIQEIEQVNDIGISSVQEHINKSLAYLSNRDKPDYENSIKESISAVEAMCNSIVGKGTLGQTLNKLEQNGIVIHGALKGAFSQLYGWTSDANGIRHAGDIGGASSTFDEAKFMLVSCCAFINYLKSSLKD